jgi:acetyl-CoA carboxylase biotin carboxylase subunit
MFERVLVANRGEIAVRIVRAVHELGAAAVAVYSDADRDALHVRLADYALPVGPAPAAESYLNADAILEAARRSGAQAVHPGYGFLSESAAFARACEAAGLTFVGPTPEALALMGDKVAARGLAAAAGVPTVPGTPQPVADDAAAVAAAAEIGFPLLIKAAAGGGGKGMRSVAAPDGLLPALAQARRETQAAFGDGRVYLEKLVQRPRHIEVQLFGDGAGRVVPLGERECSLQRRFQKVVEESPAPGLPAEIRRRLWDAAVAAAAAARYRGAGTIEFLYEPGTGSFYFLEMNARLQVEHPVTEMVTGIDLVQAQLRLAAGESLDDALRGPAGEAGVTGNGGAAHAVEARIMAEDPLAGWLPSTGTLGLVREPGGLGVRVDSACEPGLTVTVHYDALLAKLICWGRSRDEAIARLRRALDEYLITGVRTSLPFHRWLVREPAFLAADLSTDFIAERWAPLASGPAAPGAPAEETETRVAALVAATATAADVRGRRAAAGARPNGSFPDGSRWRDAGRREAVR